MAFTTDKNLAERPSHAIHRFLSFSSAFRRGRFGLPDLAVGLGTLLLLYVMARVGSESLVHFAPPEIIPTISLDPRNLPNYAARSTLRMFIALACSLLFTFVYGYTAARSRRAEKILVPLLDILQSIPVLGFLSITVTGFIALFRGSLLGLEAASIFAIFTGQAWNMTFSFYLSLRTLPRELDEMARLYRLSRWERFTRLELPSSAIGLVWNGMMSFGGGWFFLAASEAISVLNRSYTLPGLGSYVAAAVNAKDMRALSWALITMVLLVVAIDQFFWRPLVTLSDIYKMETSGGEVARFWVVDLWRSARLPSYLLGLLSPLSQSLDRALSRATPMVEAPTPARPSKMGNRIYNLILGLTVLVLLSTAVRFIFHEVSIAELGPCPSPWSSNGGARVAAPDPGDHRLDAHCRRHRIQSALVPDSAASRAGTRVVPRELRVPLRHAGFLRFGISLNWGSILLMSLGAQWYLLFNIIGGAQSIPNDLREMAASMGLRRAKVWRVLIGPGVFASWVTGAITASGGAWNASIVAEVVSWGHATLRANGLGAYIAEATAKGDLAAHRARRIVDEYLRRSFQQTRLAASL